MLQINHIRQLALGTSLSYPFQSILCLEDELKSTNLAYNLRRSEWELLAILGQGVIHSNSLTRLLCQLFFFYFEFKIDHITHSLPFPSVE